MLNEDVDDSLLKIGAYCHKKCFGCFCVVGWPYERQCVDCRDSWKDGEFRNSYCICPPKDYKFKD